MNNDCETLLSELIFEWDEEKRQKNIIERGLDILAVAAEVFSNEDLDIQPDDRVDYGEQRFRTFATFNGNDICLCFTHREESIRLITVFRVHKK